MLSCKLLRAMKLLLALMAASVASLAYAERAAMITDLEGRADVIGTQQKLSILSDIDAGTPVQLGDHVRLVAVYLNSGDEYTFIGPATIIFRSNRPETQSGPPPRKRSTKLGQIGAALRIKPEGVAQAATVMRSLGPTATLKLRTLSGTKTLEARPEFRWTPLRAGLDYEFELWEQGGKTLIDTKVRGESFHFPENVALMEGKQYVWKVSARLEDHVKYSSMSDFSLAPRELRAQVDALRPPVDAPLSERVTFAAWLDQMELHDEARRYWVGAARERPADQRLKALARTGEER